MTRTSLATSLANTSQQSGRTAPLTMFVLHHAATTSLNQVVAMMVSGSKQVSAHTAIKDDQIVGVVEEENRAWSLSDAFWDSRALTTECANESTNGWTISAASHESIASWVADASKRHGIWPHRSGDATAWTVIGHREVYIIHGGSYATACPVGMDLDWITARAQQIINGGNARKQTLMSVSSAGRFNSTIYIQFEPGCPFLPISSMDEWNGYAAGTGATYAEWSSDAIVKKYGTSTDWTKLAPSTHGAKTSIGEVTVKPDTEIVKRLTAIEAAIKAPRTTSTG